MASQVPYTGEPTVAPTDAPIPSRTADAPLSAFGGASAAAESQLGGQLEKSGTELWDRAVAMQQLNQQADAINKISDLADKQTDEYMKFRSLEGKAAVDAFPGFKDKMNQMREDVGATLGSDYARKLYLQESRAQQTRVMFSAAAHAGDQQKSYLKGTSQAHIDSGQNAVSAMPDSEEAYQDSLNRNRAEAEVQQGLHGWSDDQKQDFIRTQDATTVYNRVTALARTQPLAAQKILDKAMDDGKISGDMAGKAAEFVRTHKLNVTSRVESANIITGEGGHFGEGKVSPDRLLDAVRANESGGNYQQIHPDVTHKVNGQTITEHALGAYGIMQSNLQPWLKEAGMPAMSEQEFLNDSKAQDNLARFKLSQYQDQYGSANKAALTWFTGSPNPDPNRSDGGTTAARYVQKLNGRLAQTASGSEVQGIAGSVADKLAPNDPELKESLSQRTLALHRQTLQVQREDEFYRTQTVANAMAPGQDGKLVTSVDEFSPEAQDAYANMNPTNKARVQKVLAQNAKGDYTETPENQKAYRGWIGKILDQQKTPEAIEEIVNHDFANEPMPWAQRKQLMDFQTKVFKGTLADPGLGQTLQVLSPMMQNAGIDKKKDSEGYAQFTGALHLLREQFIQDNGKKPGPDDIRTMGAGLLREQSYPGSVLGIIPWSRSESVYRLPVPERDRNEITNRFKADQSREPTETEVQSIYAARQFNLFYSKPKTTEASAR